jgi:hypothetical protein
MFKLKKRSNSKKLKFRNFRKNQSAKLKTGGKKPAEPNEKPVENEKTEEKKRRKTISLISVANGPAQLYPALSGATARSRVEQRIGSAY